MEVTFAAVPSFPITKSVTSDRNSCSLSIVRRNKFVQLSFSSTSFRTNKSPLFKVLSAERDHVQVVEGSGVDEIYDALVRRILPPASVSLNPNYKFFVGLAGPPGAGKSTIAHEVASRVNKLWPEKASSFDSQVKPPDVAIVIPMDGFHLYRSELDAMKDMGSQENEDCLPPPPPIIPSDVEPIKIVEQYEHYSLALFYEDGRPIEGKGAGRKILDRVQESYNSELNGKDIVYDGEKTLFTIGSLVQNKLEFKVVLEDVASNRNNGNCSPEGNGCPLERQNFFHNDPKNFTDVGGGVLGCKGLHSSFRTTQSGLSLNIDLSTTVIVRPGPVVDFLIANQNVRDSFSLEWNKAKRTLKNLRVTTSPSNQEYKITGLSELPCKDQLFTLKKRGGGEDESEEITI
ncbi:protein argonaute 4-like [Trifolium pratense]|uniref:Protein argonaute 4-like n=1 Tax=Trifolium pratense TaxID=57577 RepID=A0A2K3NUL2_TRIPR|nr:protein argonaute 4-like [Trifolium pratense]